jgi:LysR family transcriptional regulator, carnitine catabolism transcriptional activator
MDLRRLTYFLGVVDHGGFTAAADEVDVSQPALSLAVKELERELGVALFDRVGRRVRLTPAGQALVGPARQALRDVETGRAAVAAVAGLRAGSLALASLPTLTADPLAGLVGRYRRRHPGVTVDLAAPEDSSDLVAMVRDGRCEAGITEITDVPADLTSVAIGGQALLLILPPDLGGWTDPVGASADSGAGSGPGTTTLDLIDLVDVPFVAAPVGTSTRRLLDEGFAAAGAAPRVAVVTAQRDAILPLVLAGAGAALVPEPIAVVAAALGARVVRPSPSVERTIALVHRAGPLAPAAASFVDLATGGDGYGAGIGEETDRPDSGGPP